MITQAAASKWLGVSRFTFTYGVAGDLTPQRAVGSQAIVHDERELLSVLNASSVPSFASKSFSLRADDKWLRTADLCELLGVTKHAVLRWCAARAVPHYRFGKACIRFTRREISVWVLAVEKKGARFCALDARKRAGLMKWVNAKSATIRRRCE